MKILLIGGPRFLGRAIIEAALARGHAVTTFNRGQTNPDSYPQAEKLHGDRDGALDALKGRAWDAVIDTSGYVPRVVRQSAELLRDAVGVYAFISSISVYTSLSAGIDEEAPRQTLDDPMVETITGETYGGLKALCEDVVMAAYGPRALIIRPGMIVGAHDLTYRFPYWVNRIAQGGDVLYPGDPHAIQLIDAVDQAHFALNLLEQGRTGVFNTTGPETALPFVDVLRTIQAVAGADVRLIGAPDSFLIEQGVAPWSDLPFWLPGESGWSQVDIARARAAGLTFRPLADTVRDTLDWLRGHQPPQPFPSGISRERETELLRLLPSA